MEPAQAEAGGVVARSIERPEVADVTAVVDPRRSVSRKRTPQSTNPDAVASALEEARAWVSEEGTRRG
jgi:hypothetical protein